MPENNQNPEKALKAILAADTTVKLENGNEITIKPISISTMAMLDMIHSPMIYSEELEKSSIYDLVPSFFVCIKGYKECAKSENLVTDAFDYFDDNQVSMPTLLKIKDAIFKQLYLATEIASTMGEGSDDKKKS